MADKIDDTTVTLDYKEGKVLINGQVIDALVDEDITITHVGMGIIEVQIGIYCSSVEARDKMGEKGLRVPTNVECEDGVLLPDLRTSDTDVGMTYVPLPTLRMD